ncbi:thrombospondin type-1 domain-containing protein 4 [Anopheles cruzii]|uniref:thrombospondin type-1 domain-containing protein 4 n=1 Tax=Anopheles cruzii TaxID=68878 RepID=UPI0022EC254B|nr:thrombospondin type-1 domain-containing protein 4 [Anopheles cruzii]
MLLRLVCCTTIVVLAAIDPIGADLATRERIRIHREWLDRRAARRSNGSASSPASVPSLPPPPPPLTTTSTPRTTYMRKLIKFKNENEPLSENDVSFVPHFEAGSNTAGIGGSGDSEDDDASPRNQGPRPGADGNELLIDDAERYRYEVVSEREAGPDAGADPKKPLVYVMDREKESPENPPTEQVSEQISALVTANPNAPQKRNGTATGIETNPVAADSSSTAAGSVNGSTTGRGLKTAEKDVPGGRSNTTRLTTNEAQPEVNPAAAASSAELGLPTTDNTPAVRSSNVSVRHMFGPWSSWTPCSRSCGGGVKTQHRPCWKREYINGKKSAKPAVESSECIGIIKRYHLCNEQDCPGPDGDFREQQCASFNSQSFQEKRYIWEAFVKEDAECELNCKPIGMRYFATLNQTVIDGTSCNKPTDYFRRSNSGRGICVEGVCKAVHNSGVISGTFMNNGAVRCGTTVCRPVSGIYTKTNPNNGYVHVASIPSGASNITITELQNSQNYLALKTNDQRFFINGDYTISLSGHYVAAGTVFDYRRIDGLNNGSNSSFRHVEGITEWVTALGPTNEPVQLFLLSQSPNPGIKYEYLVPVSTAQSTEPSSLEDPRPEAGNEISEKANLRVPKQRPVTVAGNGTTTTTSTSGRAVGQRKRKYLWKVIGFSACSKSCGGGIQQPIIKCVRESPTRVFSPKRCIHLQQPILNENVMRCNTQPCPAYWKLGDWNQCNCEEKYDEAVFRAREVKCVQELLSGIVIQVSNGACMDELPPSTERCECSRVVKPTPPPSVPHSAAAPQVEPPRHRQTGNGQQHEHHDHHRGHRGHQQQPQHHAALGDGAGRGVTGTQNDADTTSMGTVVSSHYGHQRQDINRIHYRAESKKTGIWLTANWSTRCSTACGIGLQTRSIFCDRSSSSNFERCDLRLMPETSRECTSDRACEYGEWFTGPWTLCSGDCFNLTRSRTVLCIRNDHFAPENDCDQAIRPKAIEPCDSELFDDCKPRWHFSDWTECTKPCGSGNQRRVVKCLEFNLRDKMLQESVSCRYADRPTAYRMCNEDPCPQTTATPVTTTAAGSTSQFPLLDSDEYRTDPMLNDENCRDQFPNCSIVMKAKLCSFDYYMQACCVTCRNQPN